MLWFFAFSPLWLVPGLFPLLRGWLPLAAVAVLAWGAAWLWAPGWVVVAVWTITTVMNAAWAAQIRAASGAGGPLKPRSGEAGSAQPRR